jgi:MFS family permease
VARWLRSVVRMTTVARTAIVTRPLLLRCVSIFGAAVGFYLPLSVVPLYAQGSGSDRLAGLATVVLLLATVAGELATPRLAGTIGYRWALALGLTLLGAPTLALAVSADPAAILGVSVVRGIGFAVCVVAGGALTAQIIPADRRGEGLAVIGLVNGATSLVALPAGVWAADRWGFPVVFVVTALVTLAALVSVPGLPHHDVTATRRDHRTVPTTLARPALIFAAATAALGVLVTFLPLAAAGHPAWITVAALFAQPAAATATSWGAGRIGDRIGPARLLAPGLVVAAIGMAGLALVGTPISVIGGALVFGAGFGVLQNATLSLMYSRVPAGGEITVSAVWNIAYDLGMAAGALAAGLVIASIGYPVTFALAAAAILPALALTRPSGGRSTPSASSGR